MSSKQRDALLAVYDCAKDGVLTIRESAFEKVTEALAEPVRNCDVGTAEEQTERYRKFCSAHKYLASDFTYLCKGFGKGRCPFSSSHTKSQCEFAWAQMPYEAKESEVKE